MLSRRFRLKIKVAFLLIFCCIIIILNTELSPDFYFIQWSSDNVSCYDKNEGTLPYLPLNFNPQEQSIYFHETSCNGGLNSRQACSVEAAAKLHEKWSVYVLFTGPITDFDQRSFKALKAYKNAHFFRINSLVYSKGTPLERMAYNGALNRTRWRISHMSDFLRYLTLYKWGGVYLDLDTVVIQDLGAMGMNWAARESDQSVAAGAMAFSRDAVGRRIASAAVEELSQNWRGDMWGHNGPGVITRVLRRSCSVKVADMSAAVCQGFEVYEPELFYPIHWKQAKDYLKPSTANFSRTVVHHVWNKITQFEIPPKDSLYVQLAKEYCPIVYGLYENDFGV